MRVIVDRVVKNSSGKIELVVQNSEDIWNLYNIIQVGDQVRGWGKVKTVNEREGTDKRTVKVNKTLLTINVTTINIDLKVPELMLRGVVCAENEHAEMGQHHNIFIRNSNSLTIEKEFWDTIAFEKLKEACDPSVQSELAAILMHSGLANICLVTSSSTFYPSKIEVNIPRKRTQLPTTEHDKAKKQFFDKIIQSMLKDIRLDIVKCVVVASPGFLKDDFFQYLFNEVVVKSEEHRGLLQYKPKFVLLHSSSGHKGALTELLKHPSICKHGDLGKCTEAVLALENFLKMLKRDIQRACYGVKQVEKSAEMCAVETLLICDSLFRSTDPLERKKYVDIVESVKGCGGTVHILPSRHIAGEELSHMCGVAAILRFPLPELDNLSQSDDDDDEDDEMEFA